jgi:hypothetical protein
MIESEDGGSVLGLINWFAVHPTSMTRENKLISGDSKGVASAIFEKKMNPEGTLVGKASHSQGVQGRDSPMFKNYS